MTTSKNHTDDSSLEFKRKCLEMLESEKLASLVPMEKLEQTKKNVERICVLSEWLDTRFCIAGFRFGLDPLLGLLPVFGDTLSFFLALYIVWLAIELELPTSVLLRMLGNVLLDTLVGALPFLGDFADFFLKSNQSNANILVSCVEERKAYSSDRDLSEVVLVILVAVMLLLGLLFFLITAAVAGVFVFA